MKQPKAIAASLIAALVLNSSVLNSTAVLAYDMGPFGKVETTVCAAPNVNVSSEKNLRSFVSRMYKACLNREASADEVETWISSLTNQETTGSFFAYVVFNSQEFMNRDLCDDCYISALYKALLGRAPDSEGKNNWINLFDEGLSRNEVLKEFTDSSEFQTVCANAGILPGSIELDEEEQEDDAVGVYSYNYLYDLDFGLERYLVSNPDYGKTPEVIEVVINEDCEETVNEDSSSDESSDNEVSLEADEASESGEAPVAQTELITLTRRYTNPYLPVTRINSEWFIDTSTRNNLDLVIWARMALEEDWGYEYGAYGQICDDQKSDWYGHRVVDCSGLIKSYFWYNFDEGYFSWGLNGFEDTSSETMWEHAEVTGDPEELPDIPGLGLYHPGHVGIYIGDGKVIEASNSTDGMLISDYNPEKWDGWFEINGLTYLTPYGDVRRDYSEHITFGNYQGMPMSWTVTFKDEENNRMMLVSDYAIECLPYNIVGDDCNWENSTLRTWLNDGFYNMTFKPDEIDLILTTTITTGTNSPIVTEDKVYILSSEDMLRYYPYKGDAKCLFTFGASTIFNVMNGYMTDGAVCWLRDSGSIRIHNSVSVMEEDGTVNSEGVDGSEFMGVRPVIWITME